MELKHILVATDFSNCSKHALDVAVDLAQAFDAELTLFHAWEIPSYSYGGELYIPGDLVTPIEEAAKAQLERAKQALAARYAKTTAMLRSGQPWEEVLSAAEASHADLIVIGTHGRRGLRRALLGSVAEKVVRTSAVPVLTVRGSTEPDTVKP